MKTGSATAWQRAGNSCWSAVAAPSADPASTMPWIAVLLTTGGSSSNGVFGPSNTT